MESYVAEATRNLKHVAHDISHWRVRLPVSQLPLAPAVSASASTSNLAQSREADDSSMLPLSDPGYQEPHAASGPVPVPVRA
jgi:hypothetical protein